MKDNVPEVGDKIYVSTHLSICNGSSDVWGGIATVTSVEDSISGGESCKFVRVKEHPGHCYNWTQVLARDQEELKKQYGDALAEACPDEDRPWIEDGDFVDGKVYHGKPIW